MNFLIKIFKNKKKKEEKDNVVSGKNKEVQDKIKQNFGKAIKELSKQ